MPGDSIAAYCRHRGWPAALASSFRRRGLVRWTPLQQSAWEAGLDRDDAGHWLVAAPTSAGKSFVAEVAMLGRLFCGEQALWLVPTRSLAESISVNLRSTLAPLGFRVAASSGDHPDPEGAAAGGEFDLLVAVYEKALQWIGRRGDALERVGIVVADELGMLRDPERGGRLDLLLTLIAASPCSPRRLGLCAPGAEAAALAAWWGGRLLESESRPRPLREGTLDASNGLFRWRDRQANADDPEGAELLCNPGEWRERLERAADALGGQTSSPALAATLAACDLLAERGEPTLLFAPSRSAVRAWSLVLARMRHASRRELNCGALHRDLLRRARSLARREPCADHHLLVELFASGVACHHADLSAPARRLVEEAFSSGAVRILVTTATLAHGLNLAAANVVQWPRVWRGDSEGAAREAPLERWRWREQGGRAARLGLGTGPGRSIVVADGAAELERLWRRYAAASPGPLRSSLDPPAAGLAALAALCGGEGGAEANVARLLRSTFAGRRIGGEAPSKFDALAEAAFAETCALGLLESAGSSHYEKARFRLTPLGRLCAARGLPPDVWRSLAPWLAIEPDPALAADGDAEALLPAIWALALAAPAGAWPAVKLHAAHAVRRRAQAWMSERETSPPPPLSEALNPSLPARAHTASAIEAGWRLAHWIGPEPTPAVEARTGWSAGMLQRAGEHLAWLASSLAEAGQLHGWPPERTAAWRRLGARLAVGASADAAVLAALHVSELGREALRRLSAAGIQTPRAAIQTPFAKLARIVESRETARQLLARAEERDRWTNGQMRNAEFGMRIQSDFGFGIPESGSPASKHLNANPKSVAASSIQVVPDPSASAEPSIPLRIPHSEFRISSPASPLLEIDLQSPGLIRVGGRDLMIAPLGWDLLATLAETPGRVLTREALYARLWPEEDASPQPQQLDAHRRRLLQKLAPALLDHNGELIQVVRGIGLRLNLAEEQIVLRRG